MMTDEYYDLKKEKRMQIGLYLFIGNLYMLGIINEAVIVLCLLEHTKHLQHQSEDSIENLVELVKTVGQAFDKSAKCKSVLDTVFSTFLQISSTSLVSSRLRYMLLDLHESRKSEWVPKGPQKITIQRRNQRKVARPKERCSQIAKYPIPRNDSARSCISSKGTTNATNFHSVSGKAQRMERSMSKPGLSKTEKNPVKKPVINPDQPETKKNPTKNPVINPDQPENGRNAVDNPVISSHMVEDRPETEAHLHRQPDLEIVSQSSLATTKNRVEGRTENSESRQSDADHKMRLSGETGIMKILVFEDTNRGRMNVFLENTLPMGNELNHTRNEVGSERLPTEKTPRTAILRLFADL